MSNVKTGDIAWWMLKDKRWPVCLVGERASEGQTFVDTAGNPWSIITYGELHWWCKFDKPMVLGTTGMLRITVYSSYFAIPDAMLKRICSGNFQLTKADLDIFSPFPLDAGERAAYREHWEKFGSVKPRKKGVAP